MIFGFILGAIVMFAVIAMIGYDQDDFTDFGYDLMKAMEQAKDIAQQPVSQKSEYLLLSTFGGVAEIDTFTASGAKEAKEYQANRDYETVLYVKVRE